MKLKDAKADVVGKIDTAFKELDLNPESEFEGRITVEITGTVHPVKVETESKSALTGAEVGALKPCRSPYCECSENKCTHPGMYDARDSHGPTGPSLHEQLANAIQEGNIDLVRSLAEKYGHKEALMASCDESLKLRRIFDYQRALRTPFTDNGGRKYANKMLAQLDPEHFTRRHTGSPPSLGWWPMPFNDEQGMDPQQTALRWWDGERWSFLAFEGDGYVDSLVALPTRNKNIKWQHRPLDWPVASFT